MHDTSVGLRADLKPRKVVPDFRGNYPIGHAGTAISGPNGAFEEEHAEMPWVGIVSTVPDMFRFAEMFRQGGTLDGARMLSPATLATGARNWTGEKPNELYAARGRRARLGSGAGLHRPRVLAARHGAVPSHVRHAGLAGHFRQLRRRHHAVLGRSGARHTFTLPVGRLMETMPTRERFQKIVGHGDFRRAL